MKNASGLCSAKVRSSFGAARRRSKRRRRTPRTMPPIRDRIARAGERECVLAVNARVPYTSSMSTAPRGRLDPQITSLRRHAARGTLVNSSFQIFLALLGLTQRLVAAAFLTRAEFGLWAVILTVLVTLSWLKQLGISDKYIQQDEPDQELAFQKAFTLELMINLIFMVVLAVLLPVFALIYHQWQLIPPGLVILLLLPAGALQAPFWVYYRNM